MTSTAGTDEHPEVAEISAFDEGILPPDRSADLRGHLAHCLLCTDVRNSLTEIRNLLGTLPGPSRMPADVAGRIDAALAAEALINATTPDPVTDSATDPVGEPTAAPAADRAPRPAARATADPAHVSRETSAPAGRPSGHATGPSGPGRTSRRARRRWTVLTAACAAAVLGVGGLLAHSLGSDGNGSASTASGPVRVGTFSGVQLPDRVHQLLAPVKLASPNASSHAGQNTPFSAKVPVVPTCVIKATGRTGSPLASSTGTYEGHSSYLVLLPHPSDAHRVDAYVVDSACVASGSTAPGKVLTQQTYDRP